MTTDSAISALEQAQQAFDAASAQAASVQPWSQELVKFLAMSVLGFSGLVLVLRRRDYRIQQRHYGAEFDEQD